MEGRVKSLTSPWNNLLSRAFYFTVLCSESIYLLFNEAWKLFQHSSCKIWCILRGSGSKQGYLILYRAASRLLRVWILRAQRRKETFTERYKFGHGSRGHSTLYNPIRVLNAGKLSRTEALMLSCLYCVAVRLSIHVRYGVIGEFRQVIQECLHVALFL